MLEDQILMSLLGKSAESAMDEIKTTGTLSQKNAIPLMLKSQFNHIAHLDEKMQEMVTIDVFDKKVAGLVTKEEFNSRIGSIDNRLTRLEIGLENIKESFGFLKWFMVSGFSFLGILIAVVPIIYHKIL